MKKYFFPVSLFVALFILPSFAQQTLLHLENFYRNDLAIGGFLLPSEQKIQISAKGLSPYRSHDRYLYNNAWILNSATRELVWELSDSKNSDRDDIYINFSDEVDVPAGKYEVYYSTYPDYSDYNDWGYREHRGGFINRIFGEIFFDRDYDDWDVRSRDYDDLFIDVKGNGTTASEDDVYEWQKNLKNSALLDFSAAGDDVFDEKILEVSQPVKIKIYAIGEARDDGDYDFGRLIDLKTRDKLWELSYRESDPAGGARKNRMSRETISLEPGSYKFLVATDDSHSYRRWNAAPPYDPAFWGGIIWLVNPADKDKVKLVDADKYEEKNVVVKFDRVHDHDYRSAGFTLKKPLKLHIYAIGEGRDGEMYDYGWIVDANTHKRVWTMDYYETDYAGGADKNRLFDGIITLDAGNYVAHFVSDGSHSYQSWNSAPPYDETHWGMTINVLDDNFSPNDIAAFDERDDPSVLVRITRVGDYDRERQKFTLDKDQYVHVYAIGEGEREQMYDYAWIEEVNSGRTVWEMTYRKTQNAGGAHKNRLFDNSVYLKAGQYEVYYESDGSHSFDDWNADPPNDPENWGVTITREGK